MLLGIKFTTYTADGYEYSSRFAFFPGLPEAKKAAISLFHSSPDIARVIAVDSESGKVIKQVPDKRGGVREQGGRKAFDSVPRPYRQTIRFSEDVWHYMSQFPDRSEIIHKALREYIQNHPINQ